jgi:hypothetical protein
MKALGLLLWQRRLVRAGWRVEQTSNAYMLAPVDVPNPPEIRSVRCGGHFGRETRLESSLLAPASPADVAAAQAALSQRRAAIEASLLNKEVTTGRRIEPK